MTWVVLSTSVAFFCFLKFLHCNPRGYHELIQGKPLDIRNNEGWICVTGFIFWPAKFCSLNGEPKGEMKKSPFIGAK